MSDLKQDLEQMVEKATTNAAASTAYDRPIKTRELQHKALLSGLFSVLVLVVSAVSTWSLEGDLPHRPDRNLLLSIAVGLVLLIPIITVLLTIRETSKVMRLKKQVVSAYLDAIKSSSRLLRLF